MRIVATCCALVTVLGCGRRGYDVDPEASVLSGPTLFYSEGIGDLMTISHGVDGWSEPVQIGSAASLVGWMRTVRAASGEILVAVHAGDQLVVHRNAGGGWQVNLEVRTAATDPDRRPFDIGVEKLTGQPLLVYVEPAGALTARTRTGGAWSEPSPVPSPATGVIDWVELSARPGSDELTALVADENLTLSASVWDGEGWTINTQLADALRIREWQNFTGIYERVSGDYLALWGQLVPDLDGIAFATRQAGADSFSPTMTDSDVFRPVGMPRLASEPASDLVALAYVEYETNPGAAQDFVVATWTGSSWIDSLVVDSDIGGSGYEPNPGALPCAVSWIGTTATAIATYSNEDDGVIGLDFASWSPTSNWVVEPTATSVATGDEETSFVTMNNPDDDTLLLIMSDEAGFLRAKRFADSAWSDADGGGPLLGPLRVSGMPYGAIVP